MLIVGLRRNRCFIVPSPVSSRISAIQIAQRRKSILNAHAIASSFHEFPRAIGESWTMIQTYLEGSSTGQEDFLSRDGK
jgi:ribulose bisphosphate carboxylase small subunit